MVVSSLLCILTVVLCMHTLEAYKVADLKRILENQSIHIDNVLISPVKETGICNCAQYLIPLTNLHDDELVTTNIVLGYSRATHKNCATTDIYPVYRVLLNQTTFNYGFCRNGIYSRDLQDAEVILQNPKNPIPPTPPIPKPKEPQDCPLKCVDLIKNIPKGEKGEPGNTGPKGENGKQGPPGPPGSSIPGHEELKAPPRSKTNITRTFGDAVTAWSKYTGCTIDIDEGYLWNVNLKRPTDCRVKNENWLELRKYNPGNLINTGYIIIWFYWNNENTYHTELAYRVKENDIVPVLCGHDPTPIFLKHMKQRDEDTKCSFIHLRDHKPFYTNLINYIYGLIIIIGHALAYYFRTNIYQLPSQLRIIFTFLDNIVQNAQQMEPDAIEVDGELENLINPE